MVKRKAIPKSKSRSIQLRRRSRSSLWKSGYPSLNRNFALFLDNTVSVRSLLKYTGITLAFAIVLVSIFMLGRLSAAGTETGNPSAQSSQLSGQTTQVIKSNPETENADTSDIEEQESEEAEEPAVVNLSEDDDAEIEEEEETEEEQEKEGDEEDEEESEEPACEYEVAGFDYSYKKIALDVSNFNKELRGDNWGSITALKVTVTNNEPCTIVNPTKIKIKMNAKGKGSVWWDDDVFLPDSFNHMLPGATVSEIIPIHVTYSDIYLEKDFKLTLFDDYDITMATFKKYMTLH